MSKLDTNHWRDPKRVKDLVKRIHQTATRAWTLMEVCGGQTHAFIRTGLDQQLLPSVQLIHGPGCPVCVTDVALVDRAIGLAFRPEVVLCTFGDMMRVPGAGTFGARTLIEARAKGANVQAVHAPHMALSLAQEHPESQVVFFAVGFETTAPATALAVLAAKAKAVQNFSLLVSHVRVPPALDVLCQQPNHHIDGFLAAGHVCTIMGAREYHDISRRHRIPIVITGFEPVDLLLGILAALKQLETGRAEVENRYERYVSEQGNASAITMIETVYEVVDRPWRGLGLMPGGGLGLREAFASYDAQQLALGFYEKSSGFVGQSKSQAGFSDCQRGCQASDVLTGKIKPTQCPHFGSSCTPSTALGPPMVSDEGACSAYYYAHGELVS